MNLNKRSFWTKFSFIGFSAAVVAVAAAVPVSTQVAGPGNQAAAASGITAISASASQAATVAAQTAAYWTPEMMASAKSLDIAISGFAATRGPATQSATGLATAAGGMVGGDVLVQAERGVQATRRGAELATPTPLDGPYPGPHNTFYYGPKYTTFPIGTVGKLFFSDSVHGGSFQCTATVTVGNSADLDTIWSAGHCIAHGGAGHFYTNFNFCPSYNAGGVNPTRGCWAWDGGAAVPTVWINSGDLTRDFGFVNLASTGSVHATNVASITGGVGFAYNFGRDQHWFHYGYPCVSPWNCVQIVETASEHRYDVNIGGSGPDVNSWGSAQNEGSSGSGVILLFSYSGGYLNSNVSFYFSGGPNGNEHNIEIQGPYYDTFACTVWKLGTGYTGTC